MFYLSLDDMEVTFTMRYVEEVNLVVAIQGL